MSLLKRFTPQLALLTVICLIATFGYIKTEILEVGSSPDTIPSVILDAGHGGLPNTIH